MKNFSSLALYKDLFDRLKEPVLLLDFETLEVLECNSAAEVYWQKNISGENWLTIFPESDNEVFNKELRVVKRRYHPREITLEGKVLEEDKVLELTICPLDLTDGTKTLQFLIKDVTEIKNYQKNLLELNKQLAELSITDGLTGLYNKRHFEKVLSQEHERSTREKKKYSVILMDVDNFKNYNDTNGHPAGDELLKQLSEVIKNSIRAIDVPCRYGGEEFVVICPNTNAEESMIVAERIRLAVEKYPFNHREKQPLKVVSVSMGISVFPEHSTDSNQMKELADQALYESKRGGRNQARLAKLKKTA